MSDESNFSQRAVGNHDAHDSVMSVANSTVEHEQAEAVATSKSSDMGTHTAKQAASIVETKAEASTASGMPGTSLGKRWWAFAAASALLLTALSAAAVYLVTKKPSTVDQLVILTVPSGADIKLDSKDYGHSPVKLERLAIGTYTVEITKEGFEPIVETITVAEPGPVEYKLKPVLPSEAVNLPPEEQIRQFQQQAEEAFARGYFGVVYEGSALNYADLIIRLDSSNSFAWEMRERIRKAAHQSAQKAIAREDLAQAQDAYNFLVEYFNDEEARTAAARLENQLSALTNKVRGLVRQAEEALRSGRLTEPAGANAYYYSKQALAIDRQSDKARQIRNQVKETLASAGEQAYARGDVDAAVKQLEQVVQLFPEDKQVRSRVREMQTAGNIEKAKAADPTPRRIRGLDQYRKENFLEAIPDLEFSVFNGRSTPDVIFALARSYMMVGKLDQAESYFKQVPAASVEHYRSSISLLGDIAYQRGDTASAVERWKEARQLGGSTMYSVATLEDKIERVERKQRDKAAEPQPLTIQVKHQHGGLLQGSCSGTLTVSSTGVAYEGKEHTYSYNVAGVQVRVAKDEMTIQSGKDSQKFKVARSDAERFRETLNRYQNR